MHLPLHFLGFFLSQVDPQESLHLYHPLNPSFKRHRTAGFSHSKKGEVTSFHFAVVLRIRKTHVRPTLFQQWIKFTFRLTRAKTGSAGNRFSLFPAQEERCKQTVCFFPLSHSKPRCLGQGSPVYRAMAHGLGLYSSTEQCGTLWHLAMYYCPAHIHSCSSSRGSSCSIETPELQPRRGVWVPLAEQVICLHPPVSVQLPPPAWKSLPAAVVGCLSRLCCHS